METLLQDMRFGIRILLKKPAFTLIAFLTLALGIGANTAIFTVVNGVLLRPLPYPESERLMEAGRAFAGSDERRGDLQRGAGACRTKRTSQPGEARLLPATR
jgi:hypothetical protein